MLLGLWPLPAYNSLVKQEEIDRIRTAHGLQSSIARRLKVGFTNEIYQLDDEYILKICSAGNEMPFRNEVRLYDYFHSKLPVPRLLTYDDSWSLVPRHYMIYERIGGENLYNVWHKLSDEQRRQIVKQLCKYLRIINGTNISDLPKDVEIPPVSKWREVILGQIDSYLKSAQIMGTLTKEDISGVRQYSERHAGNLDEQVITLVFWDVHFDNILVKHDKIVGLLDLERTELASIDFVLDTVKRMVDFPKKYASEYAEQFVKGEDYARLLDWYKEFYPELFKFRNLERRLDLYALAHDLKDLEGWPNVQELKDNIRAICL